MLKGTRKELALELSFTLLQLDVTVAITLSIVLIIVAHKIEPLSVRLAFYIISLTSLLVHLLRTIGNI